MPHRPDTTMVDDRQFRDQLLDALGGPWPEPPPLDARVDESREWHECRLEKVSYQLEPDERVSAFVLVPPTATPQHPAPGICVWHQHNGQWHLGKSEPVGLAGDPMHHTGLALAKEGYVVVCPDAIGFEEREQPYRLKGRDLEQYLFLNYVVAGTCLAWKNILDMRRAVDLLSSRPEVDESRIGCYGHSMGSTHTWLVGPWEPRLRALVGNCCLPTYAGIKREQLVHCFPNFIPGLAAFGDTPHIAALIAPRPLHLNFGELDRGSPIDEVRRGVEVIRKAYVAHGAAANFSSFIELGVGHVLSPPMWEHVRRFFDRHLKN